MKRSSAADRAIARAKGERSTEDAKLIESMRAEIERLRRKTKAPRIPSRKRTKAARHVTRVIVPDSHGAHIDPTARAVFLADLARLRPEQVVLLGDHLDAGGTFSSHQATYTNELTESYQDDVDATNAFLDEIRLRAPHAEIRYIEGNHEQHVERWCARNIRNYRDAEMVRQLLGPEGVLRLKQREIAYYRRSEFYDGLSIPGTTRWGRCFFTHGVSHSKSADSVHLERFGASVVFGHVHRSISVVSRTVTSTGHGAWCPGTLAKLQPLYKHTQPSTWSLGYGLQFVNASTQSFAHWNVPILGNVSMLDVAIAAIGGRK